ncbi:MAG: phage tail protein [Bacilli bacterium]|nr:phage tail protein [Bacilli bacterium]
MSANKVKYGLSNVHIAPITAVSSSGVPTYGTPVAVPGAVNLTLSASGDKNSFYADNIKYFESQANQGYEGELEIAMIPDAIRTGILGETTDSNGAFIENAEAKLKNCAIGFQINGDQKNRKFWYYNCSLSRPANNGSTQENNITPQTDTLSISAMPREDNKNVRVFIEETTENKTAFDGFFTNVYEAETSE